MSESSSSAAEIEREPAVDHAVMLRRFLAEQDVPCPSCRYNLRGLEGQCCPECGSALVLRVGLAQPISIAWVVGLVASGMGFAGAGTFLALALVAAPPGWVFDYISGWIMVIFTPICLALLVTLVAMRRRFSRWPRLRQRLLAGFIGVGVLVALVLIVVLFDE